MSSAGAEPSRGTWRLACGMASERSLQCPTASPRSSLIEGTAAAHLAVSGRIVSVQGPAIVCTLPQAAVGDLCWVQDRRSRRIEGQVISFRDNLFTLALFREAEGLLPGARVWAAGSALSVPVGRGLLGRVIDPLGNPLDEPRGTAPLQGRRALHAPPPPAVSRPLISAALQTGIRAIDGFCTIGYGQRIAICAPAGAGKSTLLGMIASHADVDVTVVALVGERGREVRECISDTLGKQGLARSVLVVATSDDSSLLRQAAPFAATAIAEHFRDQGMRVLLIVDSLTRMARAVRETSLAAGELPVRQGYTNAVYTQLPKLVERAGCSRQGSITAIYTVLTSEEGDLDPLADEIKSLLDGHIVLRHEIAALGVLPAIDVTRSVSRLFNRLVPREQADAARTLSRLCHRLLHERQVAMIGGAPDEELALVLRHQKLLLGCMAQGRQDTCSREETWNGMREALATLQAPARRE